MDNTNQNLFNSLKNNPGALQAVLQSRDGQQLIQKLTANDGGASLQRAAKAAVTGNTAELSQMISRMMESPDGAEIIQRINGSIKK